MSGEDGVALRATAHPQVAVDSPLPDADLDPDSLEEIEIELPEPHEDDLKGRIAVLEGQVRDLKQTILDLQNASQSMLTRWLNVQR